jgi:hypothetical protein
MKVNCDQHGKTMELLALRLKLEKGIPNPVELSQVKERIETLEKELGLD